MYPHKKNNKSSSIFPGKYASFLEVNPISPKFCSLGNEFSLILTYSGRPQSLFYPSFCIASARPKEDFNIEIPHDQYSRDPKGLLKLSTSVYIFKHKTVFLNFT